MRSYVILEAENEELKKRIRELEGENERLQKVMEHYKGFIIDIEKIDNGYSMGCYRLSDKWMLVDEWNPCIKTKKDAIKECKITVDNYWKNPSDYKD